MKRSQINKSDTDREGGPITETDRWEEDNSDIIGELSKLGEHVRAAVQSDTIDPLEDAPAPKSIGKYRIVRQLGSGGQAGVYEGYDSDLQRRVVIKIYHTLKTGTQLAALNEGRALVKINSPYVAQCFAVESDEHGAPFLVMEWTEGQTLDAALDSLSRTDQVRLLSKLCEGISEVHAAGVVHGDIKPSNVLVDKGGNPRLIDFGLAREQQDDARPTAGTLAFASPEQATGDTDAISTKTDIFGVGGLIYFMLTRSPLYPSNRDEALAKAQRTDFPPLTAKSDQARLVAIANRCLQQNPESRFASADALRSELTRATQGRMLTVLQGAVAAMVVALLAFGGWHLFGSTDAIPEDVPTQSRGEQIRNDLDIQVGVRMNEQLLPKNQDGVFEFQHGDEFVLWVTLEEPTHVMVIDFASRNTEGGGVLFTSDGPLQAGQHAIPQDDHFVAQAGHPEDFLLLVASNRPIPNKEAREMLDDATGVEKPGQFRSFVLGSLRKDRPEQSAPRFGAVLFRSKVHPRPAN